MCEITLCFQARKKQLHRGKVPLLLCVVDSIDWHGCDLSVALKDRSGQDSCSVCLGVISEIIGNLPIFTHFPIATLPLSRNYGYLRERF